MHIKDIYTILKGLKRLSEGFNEGLLKGRRDDLIDKGESEVEPSTDRLNVEED